MILVFKADILATAPNRPPGYVAALLAAADRHGDGGVYVPPAAFAEIRRRFPAVAREYGDAEAAADALLWPAPADPAPAPLVPLRVPAPPPPAIEPLPRADWPVWTVPIALMRNAADRGIGDTIARNLSYLGGDAFERLYKLAFGADCGCGQRAARLNQRFPY